MGLEQVVLCCMYCCCKSLDMTLHMAGAACVSLSGSLLWGRGSFWGLTVPTEWVKIENNRGQKQLRQTQVLGNPDLGRLPGNL